jgi:choline dehydrogenase-like flavoprotein
VVDGSFMVTSAAVNPTLAIVANSLRVGDHLLERLGAPAAGPACSNQLAHCAHGRTLAEVVMAK